MRQRNAVRGTLATMVAAVALLAGTTADADEREKCATAADQGQQLRDEGKYRRAREQFLVCARETCPAPIKKDCSDWLMQLDGVAPTVVLGAKEGTRDLVDVKVSMDGTPIAEKLDGKPIPMDLGAHTFKFTWAGQTRTEQVVIGAGQKGRNIVTTFTASAAPAAPTSVPNLPPPVVETQTGETSLVPAYIVGGIGLAGVTSFGILALLGTLEIKDMESECKPNCDQARVDSAQTKLIVGDISLGIGLVALGVATYMILTRPQTVDRVDRENARGETGLRSVRLDLAPMVGGMTGAVGARF